jgi:hypothetical protein
VGIPRTAMAALGHLSFTMSMPVIPIDTLL